MNDGRNHLVEEKTHSFFQVCHTDARASFKIKDAVLSILINNKPKQPLIVLCIGTDRSTGDCLGPLVGTRLHKTNEELFTLYGTLKEPVHAINLSKVLHSVFMTHNNPYIIAIDACLGHASSVGSIQVCSGSIQPGSGVNKSLPPVGNMHITGVVNVSGFMQHFVLQNTRLNTVTEIARVISVGVYSAIKEHRCSLI